MNLSADSSVKICLEDPTQPEILALLRSGEEWSAARYPSESNHHLALDALLESNVRFLVGRNYQGCAIATGAIVIHHSWAEVKAMWVSEAARGYGISRTLLTNLEVLATGEGVQFLRLETGVESYAALNLYSKAGFVKVGPFGDYKPDPLSVFMEKDLNTAIR